MPEANIQTTRKTLMTKWWFWSIIVIIVVGIVVGIFVAARQDDNNEQRQEVATEVDVTGMTIKQACEKVKSSGWSKVLIFRVIDEHGTVAVDDEGHTIYSNCDDTELEVYYANFFLASDPKFKYTDENTVYINYRTDNQDSANTHYSGVQE